MFYKDVFDKMKRSKNENFIDFKSMESLKIIVNAINSSKNNNSKNFHT